MSDGDAGAFKCAEMGVIDDIGSLAYGDGVVWAAVSGDEQARLLGFDPETLELTIEIEVAPVFLGDLAAGDGAAWVTQDIAGDTSVFKVSA